MAACPKIRRWGGALSRDPRVFFADSPRTSTPLLTHLRLPRFPTRPPFYAFFSLPFFVPATPPPPLAADVDVDPAIRRLCRSHVRCTLQFRPQGCILRDPSNQPLPLLTALRRDTFVRCYIRYLRRVMYAPVFGRVFTRPLFDDRLCLMLNETRRNYYRSVYCLTPFRRNAALETVSRVWTYLFASSIRSANCLFNHIPPDLVR